MNVFATSGTAWDGQPWVLAPALVTFTEQITELRPGGPYATDGTVASIGHDKANANSDHTVWPKSGPGVVYAADVAEDGGLIIDELFEQMRLKQDHRLKYAIHAFEGTPQMFSSYSTPARKAWEWGPYTGYNPHTTHGHLSIWHDPALANDASPWDLGSTGRSDMSLLPLKYRDGYPDGRPEKKEDVKLLQDRLNFVFRPDPALVEDGRYGDETVAVVAGHFAGDGKVVNKARWTILERKYIRAVAGPSEPAPVPVLEVEYEKVVKSVSLG